MSWITIGRISRLKNRIQSFHVTKIKTLYLRFQWSPEHTSHIWPGSFSDIVPESLEVQGGITKKKKGSLATYSGTGFHDFSQTTSWNVFLCVLWLIQTKNKTNKKSMFKLFNHCHSRAQIQQKVDYKAQSGNY